MLFSLTVLASNLQGLIGQILTSLFLFWEDPSMRSILAKNVIAHRSRNRLTSNIYALTLGCIIFLIVSANLQVESIEQLTSMGDADIVISSPYSASTYKEPKYPFYPNTIDPIVKKYEDKLSEHAYLLPDLKFLLPGDKIKMYA